LDQFSEFVLRTCVHCHRARCTDKHDTYQIFRT
jgi:hypothetical protein